MASGTAEQDSVSEFIHDTIIDLTKKLDGNKFANDIIYLLQNIKKTTDVIETSNRWLKWARQQKYLKVINADIPIGVLPNGKEGEIIDIKVFAGRKPDDELYDNNEELRKKVARGNCFISIKEGNDVRCVLQAMKKFTGGLGDDDDREQGDNSTWKKYFIKPLEETESVIATRKANGEAAHLSCFMVDGEYVLCGGSKNVHMVFRKKEDILRYTEPRFRIASEVCLSVWNSLDKMSPDDRNSLLQFLVATGYTGVFEILSPDHQHVEDLSYLSESEMRFITWTQIDLEPSPDNSSLATVPPHLGIEIAKALGLLTIKYDVLPMSELDTRMKQIRQGYQYEGEVLYFMDKTGIVTGLLKKKTVWYIMCRAIREKLRAACAYNLKTPEKFSISKYLRKTDKRLDEIQIWLGLDMSTINEWKTFANKFIRHVIQKVDLGEVTSDDIANIYPVIWKRYVAASGESDDIKVVVTSGS